ncbi:MAG TPA: class II aldolase/adducin family protein [Fermentimonas caenicola]|jgi:L-fuculose-phosphate aldolase|nr:MULTISPECIES: class II aldolase/adducin family protein [Lascolabacillus]MBP6175066.1 class II aldolase/adducin family protein [Fermentimonas sp.]MDI9625779.1 class II aldolase/adducin family protein [Bacteroidota bacterium]TAH60922.1 MAG: class II aldolase/adducin family protein [Fermentimonas caenicola]MBP6196174.1 class II aldolase/adducin family protein [Fermentimonas sp.]MBP7103893.1 class II aldolase/adducin family protein [Fermentimonas sp.]
MKQLDTKLMHPAEQIKVIIDRIYRSGMTTTSGGNISIRDKNGDIWITPSGVDKGSLTVKDIMQVKRDGTILGQHKPSSELPFHKAIYNERPEITSIIHAHPPALVAFSIAGIVPDTKIVPQANNICGDIGFAPYATPGSEDLGEKIADEFKDTRYKAVIMENHGVVLGGTDMMDAYQRFETLEFCCRTIINAKRLGQVNYLSDEQVSQYVNHLPTNVSHFMDIEYPSDERAIRTEMVEIIRRACNQGLMISTYGTVSTRWRGDDFLITPSNIARWDIVPNDIVQIKNGMAEAGKTPSRSVALHQRIYQLNPHINSIICTQPVNLMAHAVSGSKFDVRTIPESWIFLQDVPSIHFGLIYNDVDSVAKMFNKNRAVLVENDSVFITGDKLLNCFDYLEVAEFSANSLVMASSIGSLQPIGDSEIEDLKVAFNVR